MVCLVASCAGDSGPGDADGGTYLDATFLDSPFDGAPRSDGSSDGGGAADAMVSACMSGACDPREPTTCDGAEVCTLVSGVPVCTEESSAGDGLEGTTCTTSTDCAPGLGCYRRSEGGECALLCCPGDDSTCGVDMRCNGAIPLNDGSATDWWHCVGPRPCDVFNPEDKCEPQEGCYIVSPDGDTDCLHAGTADVDEPCMGANDCMPGLFCGGLGDRTCSRICGIGDGPSCPSGEGDCVAYSHSPPGTGICTVETTMMFR